RREWPEGDRGREGSYGIRSSGAVGEMIDGVGNGKKSGDGLIVELVELRENQILVVEFRKIISQQTDGLWTEPIASGPRAIDLGYQQENLQRTIADRTREPKHALDE